MRFGPTPLAEAEGALLAHSVRAGGRTFKKGRRLQADDLAALGEAGIGEVIAAILEPGDVHEDEAAARLATALAGTEVQVERPFTGRCNLLADAAGVLRLDAARVDRLNRIHEAVTLATLPDFAVLQPRQMVGTVKIIPFAVPGTVLERCLEVIDGTPLLEVAPFRPLEVALIQTRLDGTKESVLDKTVAITADRIARTGGRLIGEARCAHDTRALARRIEEAGGDLLLIAGASAITDREDVLPAAIRAAGGEIEHFGMPVDPGNLILLGRLGGRPVLGLPGCARSPKLNGFDWVLQRLAAGIEVGPAAIMGMGVGGLLAEIPTRPQPRAESPGRPGKVAGLVLAAGQSRRMGRDNKLLADLEGKPMIAHVVDALLASRASPVILVTGHEADRVRAALGERKVEVVHNPAYALGLSTSLRAGLAALPEDAEGVLIALADMPRLTAAALDRLIAAFNPLEGRGIVVPTVRGKRGNPVIFATRYAEAMAQVAGDVGARHLLGEHADDVVEIEMDDDAALLDVDTRAALEALRRERDASAPVEPASAAGG
ncbi:MAG TPA: molybdopterin-binding/glycosyltransferase family 2 protein [Geminicoccaceae bacterium]